MFALFVRRHFVLNQLALTQFRPDQMKLIVRDFGCLISADQLELLLQILINIHFGMVLFFIFSTLLFRSRVHFPNNPNNEYFSLEKREVEKEKKKKLLRLMNKMGMLSGSAI